MDDVESWSETAKGILKAEMKRRGLTYRDLVAALKEQAIDESEANLRNKISRGNFSAAFMLSALDAMGCNVIYLSTGELTRIRGRARQRGGAGSKYAESAAGFEALQEAKSSSDTAES